MSSNFKKLKCIGEGSFGKAWLVQEISSKNKYVLKEIELSKLNEKQKNEAKKEVTVLAKMDHVNIVKYIDNFLTSNLLGIIMEYCDGGDIYQKIQSKRGIHFHESTILDWFIQCCLALRHIHNKKILHRDIKTSNIFLTNHEKTVKLGDFGIAKVLNNTSDLARTCIGTPYYLSPEICEHKPYNNKSDIWALGCVLYEMCTLKHAFEAGNMKGLIFKIVRGNYPPIPARYAYEIKLLIAQMFRQEPRERPSINAILRKPFLMKLIRANDQYNSEINDSDTSSVVSSNFGSRANSRPASSASRRSYVSGVGGALNAGVYEPKKNHYNPFPIPKNPRERQLHNAYAPKPAQILQKQNRDLYQQDLQLKMQLEKVSHIFSIFCRLISPEAGVRKFFYLR